MDALIKKAQAELNRGKLENAILTFTEALSLGGFVHVTLSRSVPPSPPPSLGTALHPRPHLALHSIGAAHDCVNPVRCSVHGYSAVA